MTTTGSKERRVLIEHLTACVRHPSPQVRARARAGIKQRVRGMSIASVLEELELYGISMDANEP